MNIQNIGEEDDRLISASCGCASKAEVHQMSNNNNIMSMRHMTEGLMIPAKGEVTLKPGGCHIMFMGLKKSFVADDTVKATLTFEKAGEVTISLKVMSLRGGKKKMHDSHSKH
jgi:copper(I)-binding protein